MKEKAFFIIFKGLSIYQITHFFRRWDSSFNICNWIDSKFSSFLHCYIMFWTCPAIWHLTFHIPLEILYDNWSLLKLITMPYQVILNYVVMLSSNKPIKVAHLQKLANQVFNSALVIGKWINNSSSESKKNFCCLIKWGTSKIYVPLDFTKHLNYLEVQKILKVVNA